MGTRHIPNYQPGIESTRQEHNPPDCEKYNHNPEEFFAFGKALRGQCPYIIDSK